MNNKSVTIAEGQTIEDITLQIYGTVERVFDVIELLGVDNISSRITGITFSYTPETTEIPSLIRSRGLKFATKNPAVQGCLVQKNGFFITTSDGFKILV